MRKFVESRFCHPAFDALTTFPGGDKSRPRQLLQVVGNGGLANTEAFAEFTDAKTGTGVGIDVVLLAATGQAQKNRQSVGMSKGLESEGEFLNVHILIIIE